MSQINPVLQEVIFQKKIKEFSQTYEYNSLKNKAKIDHFYYCPYHPKGIIKKYKKSKFRKPANGMLLSAIKKFKIHRSDCFMIGDKKTDYLCAMKTQILFEYKQKYSLERQVIKILKKTDVI